MKHLKRYVRLGIPLLTLGFSLLLTLAPASAATSNTGADITQDVAQSYHAGTSIPLGTLVKLKAGDASTVVPLNGDDSGDILGVTVAPKDSALTLTPQSGTSQQVYVATAGQYNVLVSNQNGNIQVGDYITISSLTGVGMRADTGENFVLGKAAAPFNGTSGVTSHETVKDGGKTSSVAVGSIPVDINIGRNPLVSKVTDYVPSFLSKAAVTVASKPVSAMRIYVGMFIIVMTLLLAGDILYSGVHGGMMAIGRNPLSKGTIMRSLTQTTVAGIIIFVIGLFAVYLLLKL